MASDLGLHCLQRLICPNIRATIVSKLSNTIWLKKKKILSGAMDYLLTHLCQGVSSTITLWTSPFPIERESYYFLLLPCFTEITVFNANRVDPDQMPHSVASDLDLHCLPISLLWDARHK